MDKYKKMSPSLRTGLAKAAGVRWHLPGNVDVWR